MLADTHSTKGGALLEVWTLVWCLAVANAEETVDAGQLPVVANELRLAGVPDADVKAALKSVQDTVSLEEATEALEAAEEAVEANGPIDNFGAFVQAQLESGKRGKDLADAIKAEHEARGKGKPEHAGGPKNDKGKPDGVGKPEDKGAPAYKGKPDCAGKPSDKGKAVTKPNRGKAGGGQ